MIDLMSNDECGIFDYTVVCDTTTNTPTIIDNDFVIEIYVKPLMMERAMTANSSMEISGYWLGYHQIAGTRRFKDLLARVDEHRIPVFTGPQINMSPVEHARAYQCHRYPKVARYTKLASVIAHTG